MRHRIAFIGEIKQAATVQHTVCVRTERESLMLNAHIFAYTIYKLFEFQTS